jgi:hypothetical protein
VPRQINNNLSTEKFRNATPFSFLHLNILIKNIPFEITLTMATAVITTIIPVSAQSPSVPSEVVPSVQDYLQIASATVTNQTGGQLMNAL